MGRTHVGSGLALPLRSRLLCRRSGLGVVSCCAARGGTSVIVTAAAAMFQA